MPYSLRVACEDTRCREEEGENRERGLGGGGRGDKAQVRHYSIDDWATPTLCRPC